MSRFPKPMSPRPGGAENAAPEAIEPPRLRRDGRQWGWRVKVRAVPKWGRPAAVRGGVPGLWRGPVLRGVPARRRGGCGAPGAKSVWEERYTPDNDAAW